MTTPGDIWDWPEGWTVRRVEETGSTNADLLAAAADPATPDRTVLVAGHQTAGRGRLDRTWTSPPGANLLASILFRTLPEEPADLPHRLAVAAVRAIERLAPGTGAALKWPNDLLVGDHKLGGILSQIHGDVLVVGMGCNVGWAPPGAARLADHAAAVSVPELLAGVLLAFDELDGSDDLAGAYRRCLATLGRSVRVELPGDRTVTGRALDVERSGRLVVLDDCGITHRFDAGDVVHLR